jgi:hypothetical protein
MGNCVGEQVAAGNFIETPRLSNASGAFFALAWIIIRRIAFEIDSLTPIPNSVKFVPKTRKYQKSQYFH